MIRALLDVDRAGNGAKQARISDNHWELIFSSYGCITGICPRCCCFAELPVRWVSAAD
jgi:hypothetical protein